MDHRAALDDGGLASWVGSFTPDEASAIQHAMHLKIMDERAFYSEYQNRPQVDKTEGGQILAADVHAKINGRQRGEIASDTEKITMFIDVQKRVLYFVVCAYAADGTGAVIDYGTFPDQRRGYFTLANTKRTLAGGYRGLDNAACWVRSAPSITVEPEAYNKALN